MAYIPLCMLCVSRHCPLSIYPGFLYDFMFARVSTRGRRAPNDSTTPTARGRTAPNNCTYPPPVERVCPKRLQISVTHEQHAPDHSTTSRVVSPAFPFRAKARLVFWVPACRGLKATAIICSASSLSPLRGFGLHVGRFGYNNISPSGFHSTDSASCYNTFSPSGFISSPITLQSALNL